MNKYILPQALCPGQNCFQYFNLQNEEQTQQEAMLWNKAAFQRLETGHNLSPGSAGMGWWVWRVDVSCAWPFNCILSAWEVKAK